MTHSLSRQTRSISGPKAPPLVLRGKFSTLGLPVGFSCDGHSSHLKHSRATRGSTSSAPFSSFLACSAWRLSKTRPWRRHHRQWSSTPRPHGCSPAVGSGLRGRVQLIRISPLFSVRFFRSNLISNRTLGRGWTFRRESTTITLCLEPSHLVEQFRRCGQSLLCSFDAN